MRGAVLCMLAVGLLLPFASAGSISGAPRLAVGDFWDYEGTTKVQGFESALSLHREVMAFEAVTVGGVAVDAVKTVERVVTQTTVEGFAFSTFANTTTWARVSDLATLKSMTQSSTVGSPMGPQSRESEMVYDEPCIGFVFPLAVGNEWDARCSWQTSSDGGPSTSGSSSTHSRVTKEERAVVPAGEFEAVVVESTSNESAGSSVVMVVAAAACGPVKMETRHQEGASSMQLMAFACKSGGEPVPPLGGASPTPTTGGSPAGSESSAQTPGFGAVGGFVAVVLAAAWVRRRPE